MIRKYCFLSQIICADNYRGLDCTCFFSSVLDVQQGSSVIILLIRFEALFKCEKCIEVHLHVCSVHFMVCRVCSLLCCFVNYFIDFGVNTKETLLLLLISLYLSSSDLFLFFYFMD